MEGPGICALWLAHLGHLEPGGLANQWDQRATATQDISDWKTVTGSQMEILSSSPGSVSIL